ncbi:PP2C family protein-serine/threonine phosphatase [Acuticoccus mangrovi]|uniref:SpoIIE family protein phosphatase n=1 Tax=Acuticoccus mangrovi TaxID=2796142 RepID=A0A934IQS3_9HYPH|nr:PP2C family protein-serine/threonine phosphatase [Acuticoccus mangrovi]MBJ3776340.1 SpoIIE family protein phosphatase [Acuticoccus mangrovi]
MLLRTRITLLLSIALVVVIGSLVAVGTVRARLEQDRLAEIAIGAQRSFWSSLVIERTDDLEVPAAELAARLSVAAPNLTPAEITEVILNSPDLITPGIMVQVLDLDGELLAANAPVFRARPILGAPAIDALTSGTATVGGLRQERPDRYVITAARAVSISGVPRAVLSLAIDAEEVLQELTDRLGEPSYLMSLRGRMIAGTNPTLWEKVSPTLPRRTAAAELLSADGRLYFAAAAPVDEMMGGVAGTLVTLRDATDSLSATRRLERTGLVAVGLGSLVMIIGLYVFLRQAFMPLESAIETLHELSEGNLQPSTPVSGTGEIRRIGEALAVFRRNALQLLEQEEAIARQRQRQERIIRRQLERLAGTLDEDGRKEILSDLRRVMAEPKPDPAATAAAAERPTEALAVLATVLQGMSQRITDQHRRLTELIRELQDAIITRARLAGLEQELEIARELQRSFLPRPLPEHPAFRIYGLMETAKEVGGDFYDYFMIDDRRLGIVVADVSGKGVAAALFMAITRTLIKATAQSAPSPAATVTEVNTFLAADNEQMMFVTLFHGVLDLDTGSLTFVNAGHNPPLLANGTTGAVSELPRAGDPALAVIEDFEFTEATVTLHPDDTLFLFTDGVTEAFNADSQAFGDARLVDTVALHHTDDAAALDEAVRDAVVAFEKGAERADDLTCLTLRYFRAA